MKRIILLLLLPIAACTNDPRINASTQHEDALQENDVTAESFTGIALPGELKEISGITSDGEFIWAISDKPVPVIYKLNKSGKIVHETELDLKVYDMESLTSDASHIYIADVGNARGSGSHNIIKIAKKALGGDKVKTAGNIISFDFAGGEGNGMDCEAVFAYKDSLYLFTKQNDGNTQMFTLPVNPGKYTAQKRGQLTAGGLVTGASINHSGNEMALVGYNKGHKHPFVILIDDFKRNNFLSGNTERYELDKQNRNWQVESISYINDQTLSFACEGTRDVPQTLYMIDRATLVKLPQDVTTDESKSPGKKNGKNGKKKKKG